jgi:uncharacterized protein (TIGR02246 family)
MVSAASGVHPPGMTARTPEETHAAIEAAFNAGDLDAFVAAYEPDAVLIAPPEGQVAQGRNQIRESARASFELRPKATIRVLQKLEQDGLALTRAHWQLAGTDAEGNPVELDGRGAIVSRRQPDGSWLIALDSPISPD